jgi:hypothetical protein
LRLIQQSRILLERIIWNEREKDGRKHEKRKVFKSGSNAENTEFDVIKVSSW